ncbi:unnamed protein product [Arabidopsis thaliana]|uniref:HTH three-helical bundle domain-containing protein n=3 Tax=Arabidopsis TaxID=3701 RepID=Q6DYC0_ARATH|nr:uncharacterized protein AT3G57440 [Arabidopsis thaliana]KAG7628853.1 hypothetical protein ISN45_At03g050440 [Arabidopsis thaliana x Arabidopsis arenosa]AAT67584.1 hypothetical protein At3G57440 [Arabidopsis thaliana]AAX23873.1 hypothetical protein At3g57440 [Arabidopsis thaliana]AEE79655.1 hypothetical protein AT3G57440 [Arabidopsis thaliana]OAP03079.1 hypothetical protein AXX17_AT3G52020 [Arabidopsis thaliana]|eukprot:NP_191303.2 hypothetical protein AT3G57440 [Arabidopsis thaliana]
MATYPSVIERTVASSLLLLSYGPVFFSPKRSESVEESSYVRKWCHEGSSNLSLMLGSSGSRSCGSALSSDGSFGMSEDREFKINYTGDPFRLMNFKTARKRRSQVIWGSFNFKPTHLKMNPVCDVLSTCSVDSKDESCLSTGSSEVSSVESRIKVRNQKSNEKLRGGGKTMKESSRSSSIRRRAKDILEFLSSESSSEVHIRQILGDSPDTSKALRMLLKMEEVKRFGTGGRLDPFIYKIA